MNIEINLYYEEDYYKKIVTELKKKKASFTCEKEDNIITINNLVYYGATTRGWDLSVEFEDENGKRQAIELDQKFVHSVRVYSLKWYF